ncbi:MAG: tetratricopeptide repeat protein [Planctomycetota bacterium]|jgi:DNA-directed RNA polymerase subunit alpha
MDPVTNFEIDLFADNLPSIEEIQQLYMHINSSESQRIKFTEQVEANLAGTSAKKRLAAGIGLFILSKNQDALKKLEKAADCKEKFIYMAYALRRLGRFDEAIENLNKSPDLGADNLRIAMEKAATYRHAGKFDEAERELANCGSIENAGPEYYYQLGRLKEVKGLYAEAMKDYNTALELDPNHRKALFHLAYRCDLSGDEEAAIDYYKQLLLNSPIHTSALLNLAVLYEDAGKFHKALQCVEKVLEAHPNHQRAQMFKKDIESSMTMFYDEEKEKKKDRKNQIFETPISDFELSVRSRNCLRKMNIRTIGDLLNITEAELLSYKNFGETSLKEIKVILEIKGLRLGMALDEKPHDLSDEPDLQIEQDENQGLFNKPVDDLRLSVRARTCLRNLNIHTVGELLQKTEAELLGCKNFGATSLNEIKKGIGHLGLSLRSLD